MTAQLLTEARLESLERRIRNAVVKYLRGTSDYLVRGPCGLYDVCGAVFTDYRQVVGEIDGQPVAGLTAGDPVRMSRSNKVCVICAALRQKETPLSEYDPEGKFAELLEMSQDEVVSLLQGFDYWDGGLANNKPTVLMENVKPQETALLTFYKMGRRLAKKLLDDEAAEEGEDW